MENPITTIEQVSSSRWREWLEANHAVVVDVREPVEWLQGTLPGSRTIQLTTLPEHLAGLDPATPLLIVCRSGNRSQVAARFLAANGFTAANLAGGLKALGMAR